MSASWIYPDGKTWPSAVLCSCGMQWAIEQPAPIGCLQHLMDLEAPRKEAMVKSRVLGPTYGPFERVPSGEDARPLFFGPEGESEDDWRKWQREAMDPQSKAKLPLHLIPPEWEPGLAQVFASGGVDNTRWEKGMDWSTHLASSKRHIDAFALGEDTDAVTGLSHMLHAAWRCLAVYSYWLRHTPTDNRRGLMHIAKELMTPKEKSDAQT